MSAHEPADCTYVDSTGVEVLAYRLDRHLVVSPAGLARLHARIAELEAVNARLRARLDREASR